MSKGRKTAGVKLTAVVRDYLTRRMVRGVRERLGARMSVESDIRRALAEIEAGRRCDLLILEGDRKFFVVRPDQLVPVSKSVPEFYRFVERLVDPDGAAKQGAQTGGEPDPSVGESPQGGARPPEGNGGALRPGGKDGKRRVFVVAKDKQLKRLFWVSAIAHDVGVRFYKNSRVALRKAMVDSRCVGVFVETQNRLWGVKVRQVGKESEAVFPLVKSIVAGDADDRRPVDWVQIELPGIGADGDAPAAAPAPGPDDGRRVGAKALPIPQASRPASPRFPQLEL